MFEHSDLTNAVYVCISARYFMYEVRSSVNLYVTTISAIPINLGQSPCQQSCLRVSITLCIKQHIPRLWYYSKENGEQGSLLCEAFEHIRI